VVSLIILVFIEAQDPAPDLIAVLERTAEDALGPRTSVSVRPIVSDIPDSALIEIGHARRAWAVARVAWRGAQGLKARIDITLLDEGRSLSQPLTFEGSDPARERWRALGLVLASTLTKDAESHRGEARPDAAPMPALTLSPVPVPSSPQPGWGLDAAAEGGFPVDGAGTGAGGTLGLRWLAGGYAGLRAGVRARFSGVDAAQATMLGLAATLGGIFDLMHVGTDRRLVLAARADVMLLYEALSHLSPDDAARVRQARLLPGASALAEVRWSLSPTLALSLAAGPEVAFGTTRVFVHETEVNRLSPLRVVVQGGLVASF
jgi:hypothetical protein